MMIDLEDAYTPSDDEPFMNDRQREYFRRKLLSWKEDILLESRETLVALQNENENHPDLADRASSETDRAIEPRARDRKRKLIAKIDSALQRLDDGSYGYCEETGEPISLKRLDARPYAAPRRPRRPRRQRRPRGRSSRQRAKATCDAARAPWLSAQFGWVACPPQCWWAR